jgi:hypothetical protein
MKSADRPEVNAVLFRISGTSLERYVSPVPMSEGVPQTLDPRILLQSFGVSHMKFGAEPELRSLIKVQSVTLPQVLGFARTRLLQRAELLVMS